MSDVELIKDKIDIVAFVGEYVQLKPAGVNQKGLCPFHHEKTGSFMVNRERQRWHCFGCGKGGDIFSFLQEMEGMEFIEALRLLAERAGVPLTERRSEVEGNQKNRLKMVVEEAARFWHYFLRRMPAAAPALHYLRERGLSGETIDAWRIGYAPDQWELLTHYLLKKGLGIDDLVAAGITIRREGADVVTRRGFYDRFRDRIMFPIWDVHGTVVGFTGRVLKETPTSGGKYVNTPQTAIYDKSRIVFGLDKAKQEIKVKDAIVIVEGQMDVIACHQAGMKNVVATSGTASTEQQITLLKRYSSNLLIAFDADAAGQAAAKRGIDIARELGMSIRMIRIPEGAGKDPDECLKINPAVWFAAVNGAQDIMNWYLTRAFNGKDLRDPKQKQQIANAMLPEIVRIPFAVERDHWLREVAGRLGVDVSVLREDLVRFKNNEQGTSGKEQKARSKEQLSPAISSQATMSKDRPEVLLERLFALALLYPAVALPIALRLTPDHLSTSRYAPLYEALKTHYTTTHLTDSNGIRTALAENIDAETLNLLEMQGNLLFADLDARQVKEEAALLLHKISDGWLRQKRLILQEAIQMAERGGDPTTLLQLMQEWQRLHS